MSVLVTQQAPDFTAAAVLPNGTIVDDFTLSSLKGKYVVLFFYPLDFTFVCPSEIIAHDKRIKEFKSRGVEVVGVSIDSQFTHLAWRNTDISNGGIGPPPRLLLIFPVPSGARPQPEIAAWRHGTVPKLCSDFTIV